MLWQFDHLGLFFFPSSLDENFSSSGPSASCCYCFCSFKNTSFWKKQTCIKQLFEISVVSPVGQLYQRPKDCAEVFLNGETTSGLYTVYIAGEESQPVQVYCDMSTDGGGWMVSESKAAGRQSVEALGPYFTLDMSYTGPVFPVCTR